MRGITTRCSKNAQHEGLPFIVPILPFVGLAPPAIKPLVGHRTPLIGFRRFLGFTAIELMITLVVIAVLLSLAFPDLRVFVQNNRLKTDTDAFKDALTYAYTEARANAVTVTVCGSNTGIGCTGTAWKLGWLVWNDKNRDGDVDDNEILRVRAAQSNDIVLASTNDPVVTNVIFAADGSIASELTFTVCDDTRIGEEGRIITIMPIGQVRSIKTNCD